MGGWFCKVTPFHTEKLAAREANIMEGVYLVVSRIVGVSVCVRAFVCIMDLIHGQL